MKFSFILIVLFFSQLSYAQMFTTSFWKKRTVATQPSLEFSTAPQTIAERNCSEAVTVQTKNASGVVTNVSSNLTVNLSSMSSLSFYSDPYCSSTIASVVIPSGASSATFYFVSNQVGANNILAEASTYTSANQIHNSSINQFIWTGGGGDALWANGANWSGGAAPDSTQAALIPGLCFGNCSPVIASDAAVGKVRIEFGYAGTITQSAAFTTNSFVQFDGTFQGGTSAITINNDLYLGGGFFTSTSGTLFLSGAAKFIRKSGSFFIHNSGLFQHAINDQSSTWNFEVTTVFNQLTVSSGCGGSIQISGAATVNGTLNFNSGCGMHMSGGTINAKGNVNTSTDGMQGTTSLYINGSSNQTITGSGGGFPRLPNTFIASTGGTVSLSGNLLPNDWTYVSGSINAGTSHIQFRDINRLQTFTPGNSINYYSVSWMGSCNSGFQLVGTLNSLGTVEFFGACPAGVNGGVINAKGNVSVKGNGGNGTVNVVVNGSGNQTIDGEVSFSRIPKLEIASTGGTVTITNSIRIEHGFTYTSGTVNATSSSVEIYDGTTPNPIVPGTMSFQNVTWTGSCNWSINLTGTMTIRGTMTMDGPCPAGVTGGAMDLYGNAVINNGAGTVQLNFMGAMTTLSGSAASTPSGNITVNKPFARTLTLLNHMTFNAPSQKFSINDLGAVHMNGKNLTLSVLELGTSLYKEGGILKVNGSDIPDGPYDAGVIEP